MQMRWIAPIAALVMLPGCVAMVETVGQQTNAPNAREVFDEDRPSIGTAPYPVFYPDRLSERDTAAFTAAYNEVVSLLDDPVFAARLSRMSLRAGCLSDIRIDGATILTDLRTNTLPVRLNRKNSPGAVASTNIVQRWMRINPEQFDYWNVSDAAKADMINTLMHEITHMVPYDGTPPGRNWFYKYYDQGHNEDGCNDSDLVSYRVGDLAEEVWLERRRAGRE